MTRCHDRCNGPGRVVPRRVEGGAQTPFLVVLVSTPRSFIHTDWGALDAWQRGSTRLRFQLLIGLTLPESKDDMCDSPGRLGPRYGRLLRPIPHMLCV
jgi:hypothetical protein